MVNRVILIGRLGQDPEVRRLENGAVVAKFSVATNESFKDNEGNWQDKTEWHYVIAWRNLAERAESSLKKGTLVYVEGKLTHRKWQDKDGNDRWTTEVVASYFRIITSKDGATGSGSFPTAKEEPPTGKVESSSTDSQAPVTQEVTDAPGDDLPF